MSEATPNAAPAEQANGAGVVEPMSVEQRADAIFGTSEAAAESAAPAAPPPPADSAAASVEPDAAAQARAERRAALAKLQAQEREKVDAMAAIRERDMLRRQLEEERERAKAYANHIDPSKLTKEQFFGLAEKNPDLTPNELAEWLRERIADPASAAAKAAKSAVDPEIAQLRQQNQELAQRLEGFLQQQQAAAEEAEAREAEGAFVAFTKEQAQTAPFTQKMLAKYGEAEVLKIARRAAQSVPAHAGPQALLDEVEEIAERLIKPWTTPDTPNQQQQARVPSVSVPVAQGGISNTLAQQRSSVVDEHLELSKLSLEERAARVFG